MVASIDFYTIFSLHQASLMFLMLLSFYSHLHLLLFLAPLWTDWLPWQHHSHFYNFCNTFIASFLSTFSGPIADKDITTSMSKSMYTSMSVLEKRWSNNSRNSSSICINLIILFNLSWQRPLSYRNQSIDLPAKSMDWFLYDNGLRHERVKTTKSHPKSIRIPFHTFKKHKSPNQRITRRRNGS